MSSPRTAAALDAAERGPAFVAGATGYTGRYVVESMRARGVAVVAHVRPDSTRRDDWRARFEALGASVDTTPWEPTAMAASLAQWQPSTVFALLGTTKHRMRVVGKGGGDKAANTYEAVDYGLTRLLLDAAAACGSEPRFVYLSAMGADRPMNAYMRIRTRCEADLRASGLPWTIARPGFISGSDRDEGRLGERVGTAVSDGLLSVVGILGGRKLQNRYASLDGATLGAAVAASALDAELEGRILDAAALRALATGP